MGIQINSRTSGFRKWSEAHPAAGIARSGAAAMQPGTVAAAELDPANPMPAPQPHRPWLVPGVGKL